MARDQFHQAVREALEKDGWTITDDPFKLKVINTPDYEIDLGAEKMVAAKKGNEKIAVEVKSFIGQSVAYQFHAALGQYLNYLALLEIQEPDWKLYLSISDSIYESFFKKEGIEFVLNKYKVSMLIIASPVNTIN